MLTPWISSLHLSLLTFVILVFTQAALHKASDLRRFSGYVANYSPKLEKVSFAIASGVLLVESGAIILSVTSRYSQFGVGVMLLLLACYTTAMIISLKTHQGEIDCGCGGTPIIVSTKTIVRNSILGCLMLVILMTHYLPLTIIELTVSLCSGFALWLAYFLVEQLLHNQDSLLKLIRSSHERSSK